MRQGHLVSLDVWRGFAILALLIGHFFNPRGINFGRLGVESFFILSGFLMGTLLFVRGTPIPLFYRRRISRIFPAAYTFIALIVAFYAALGVRIALWAPVSTAAFVVNYKMALWPAEKLGLPFQHFWSLCVEEHTYILLSLLAIAHRKWRIPIVPMLGAGIAAVFALAFLIGQANGWDHHAVYWRTECRASSILLGALAAVLASRGAGSRERYFGVKSGILGTAAAMAGGLMQANLLPDFFKYTAGSALLALGVLLVSQHGADLLLWRVPALAWLGTISYSLYLWQQPFYWLSDTIGWPVALSAAFLAALASYYLVERPARLWLNRHWGSKKSQDPVVLRPPLGEADAVSVSP